MCRQGGNARGREEEMRRCPWCLLNTLFFCCCCCWCWCWFYCCCLFCKLACYLFRPLQLSCAFFFHFFCCCCAATVFPSHFAPFFCSSFFFVVSFVIFLCFSACRTVAFKKTNSAKGIFRKCLLCWNRGNRRRRCVYTCVCVCMWRGLFHFLALRYIFRLFVSPFFPLSLFPQWFHCLKCKSFCNARKREQGHYQLYSLFICLSIVLKRTAMYIYDRISVQVLVLSFTVIPLSKDKNFATWRAARLNFSLSYALQNKEKNAEVIPKDTLITISFFSHLVHWIASYLFFLCVSFWQI